MVVKQSFSLAISMSFIRGTMVDDNSDALSDVSMITNPGDYGQLSDCMIIDPPVTFPEELFDIGDLWTPNSTIPAEVLSDIQPPQSNCASTSSSSTSSVSVAGTHRTLLTDVTRTITLATLTAAAYTTNMLVEETQIVATQPLMSILAGIGEIEDGKVVVKR